jgi:CBS domain-containing protein
MKAKDAMSKAVSCSPQTNLGAVAEMLFERNCGILPIIDASRKVVGVITDRDVAIALGTRNRLAGEITAAEVATGKVESCKPTDSLRWAMDLMAEGRVRRLVVVNDENQLEGILSMDDVVRYAESQPTPDVSADDVLRTLQALYWGQMSARAAAAD